MNDDTISRQAVKELAHNQVRKKYCGMAFKEQRDFYIKLADSIIDLLPPAQPEPHYDEWCTDCKEYDKEKHSCPRWNKVIRQTLQDAQPEPCDDAVSRSWLLAEYDRQHQGPPGGARKIIETAPPVTPKQPEYHEIGYRECADAVLKMWMDNVLTDGEHNRIIDKLNAKWAIAEGDAE